MRDSILAAQDWGRAIRMLLQALHQNGQDELIWLLFFGSITGALCAIPATIIAARKGLGAEGIFLTNTVAGAAGGIYLAAPAAIITLIYASIRSRPGAQTSRLDAADRARWGPIVTPIITLTLCLLVLPFVCTTSVTVMLPDDRPWWAKLRGDPLPSIIQDSTNWATVLIISLIACVISFLIAKSIAGEGDH